MDNKLFTQVSRRMPTINPKIAKGLAVTEMRFAEQYIDDILRASVEDYPKDFTYVGIEHLTPFEEYLKTIEARGNIKPSFDMARTDFYGINLLFEYQGTVIKKFIYVPYVRKGGIISIRGASYAISPVLADKGISITKDSVFIQINKTKSTFRRRLKHHYLADENRKSPSITHGWLHHRTRKNNKEKGEIFLKMETCSAHYLFCKFGLLGTFKKFLNTNVKVGSEKEINYKNFPKEDWVICRSMGTKPTAIKTTNYTKNTIRLAIRRCDYDTISDSVIGAFFYVVDHFPDRIKPEYIDGTDDENDMWIILLGKIIGGTSGGEGAILETTRTHIASLDTYINSVAKKELEKGEIYADNIFELLYFIIEILSGMVSQPVEEISSIYDKQLIVLRYVLQDINDGLNSMFYRLTNKEAKKGLVLKDVQQIVRQVPRSDVAARMYRHNNINSVSSPGDNLFFKITGNIVLQTDSGSSGSFNKSGGGVDNSKYLHSSIAAIGSYLTLPKPEPTGRSRINPFLEILPDGSVNPDPKHKELLDRTQYSFRRN